MEKLNEIIELIKEIDECLDAYSFKGYTFEKYQVAISKGEKGTGGLRNIVKYNSNGQHIWKTWMQTALDDSKKYINKIYLCKNGKYNINNDDKEKMTLLSKRLREAKDVFKKDTDNYSIYPIKSETIGHNLTVIANYLENYE